MKILRKKGKSYKKISEVVTKSTRKKFPQSWVFIVPPAFSYFIMFIKETSLTSQIGTMELMSAGKYFNSIGISPVMAYGTCLLLYFALSYPLTHLGRRIEVRLKNRFKGNMATLSASDQ